MNVQSQILAHISTSNHNILIKEIFFICDSTEHLIAKCPLKIKEAQKENSAKQQERASINLLYSPTKEYKGNKIQIPISVEMQSKETILDNGLRLTKGFVNGKSVSVLRDTGATTIFVIDTIIDKHQLKGNKKEVMLAMVKFSYVHR